MVPIISGEASWSSVLGNFLLNFGVLEWHVLVFLEGRMTSDDFEKIKKKHFKDFITAVEGLADRGAGSPEQLKDLVRRIEPIRELRNHFAHGVPRVAPSPDGKTAELTITLPRDLTGTSTEGVRHVRFKELQDALTELNIWIEDFSKWTGGWKAGL